MEFYFEGVVRLGIVFSSPFKVTTEFVKINKTNIKELYQESTGKVKKYTKC